ncbi:MAG: hypothetical protein L3J35_11530, partial [Bacteroidales bacterium]|nr:hypothetical protein [Bacteroidales bacterium]
MKKLYKLFIILFCIFIGKNSFSQGVKVSTSGGSSHPSAILDVESTTQGLLIPRMSSNQRKLISNATSGLLVFDTDINSFFIYSG